MCRENLVEADDLVNCVSSPALVVKGFQRLGNLSLLQVLHRRIILRFELVNLKICRTCVRVSHLPSVCPGGRILGIESRNQFKRHIVFKDLRPEAVKGVKSLVPVINGIFRLEKNMPGIEHIPFLFENLDDVESVRSLDNL